MLNPVHYGSYTATLTINHYLVASNLRGEYSLIDCPLGLVNFVPYHLPVN